MQTLIYNATIYDGILNADTVITLQHTDGNATITVVDETGYVLVADIAL